MTRADSILTRPQAKRGMSVAAASRLDILVLPQMAFSGSNFSSEMDIQPFLEPAVAGETQLWARTAAIKYRCNVVVGYPQQVNIACAEPTNVEYFSSSIMVDFDGNTLANNNGRTRDGRDPTFSDCIAKRHGPVVDKALGKVSIGQCK
ncbi:hypothetical protein LLEC1_02143 [Akanthomyces lecanii]|uniref:CN hydrolase domain-containing protein n=1 Tax=Cordyceps confragosa TaxID=2714763 RepID=A0A179IFC5_CORDF|nr:hypothetical protein LLEC1_02143 [Akanthomyces lecanii]